MSSTFARQSQLPGIGAKQAWAVKEQRLPGILFCGALWPLGCSFPAHAGSQGSWSFIYRLSDFEKKSPCSQLVLQVVQLNGGLNWAAHSSEGRRMQWKERKERLCVWCCCCWWWGNACISFKGLDSFKRAGFLCEKQLPQYLSCNLLTPDGMGKCSPQLLARREAALVMRNVDFFKKMQLQACPPPLHMSSCLSNSLIGKLDVLFI